MTISKESGRQNVLAARLEMTYAELGAGVLTADIQEAFDIPVGSEIVGGCVNVLTEFDHGTSAVLDLGDGDDPNRYTASPVDLTTLGRTALTLTGTKYSAQDTIDTDYTTVGTTATAGLVEVILEYIMDDRATETVD